MNIIITNKMTTGNWIEIQQSWIKCEKQ